LFLSYEQFYICDAEQDPNAGNIYIVVPNFVGVRGDDFGHLLTLDQHANGCI